MRIGLCAAMLAVMALPGWADIAVTSPDDLAAALAQAGPGEVLLLAAGGYGALTLTAQTRKGAVTLRSADPAAPARFSGLDLRGVTGITLQGLAFDYRYRPGDPLWTAPFAVTDSQDVTLRGCLFTGDLVRGGPAADEGHATGVGLSVDHATDLTVDGNRFARFYRGLTVSDSDRVTVTGNDVSDIRSDGMDFVADQGLLVADNMLHDFQTATGSEDHPDMIQFWTAGTTRPTRDVVIRDNLLNAGSGSWTQSILMGNEVVAQGEAGPEMRYRNITITGNVIINAHLHGISVGQADGVRIAHNTLIHLARADGGGDNPTLWTPRINVDETSDHVTIEGNATAAIVGGEQRPDWTVRGNVLIQDRDPRAANHYDAVFVAAQSATGSTLAAFAYLPGGPVDGIRAGAARLIAPMGAGQPVALIRTTREGNRFDLDAQSSSGPLQGARYLWTFSDGTTAEGPQITHDVAGFGSVQARLTVQTAEGAQAVDTTTLTVPNPQLVHFDAGQGTMMVQGVALPGLAGAQGKGTWVLPVGQGLTVPHDVVQSLSGARDFDLRLRLQRRDSSEPGGEILRIHPLMVLSWQQNHGFAFQLRMGAGEAALQSRTPRLEAGRWYDLAVQYDAATGLLMLSVDGKLAARTRTTGPLASEQAGDLTFGNPYGQKSFDGVIGAFDLRANQTGIAP